MPYLLYRRPCSSYRSTPDILGAFAGFAGLIGGEKGAGTNESATGVGRRVYAMLYPPVIICLHRSKLWRWRSNVVVLQDSYIWQRFLTSQ